MRFWLIVVVVLIAVVVAGVVYRQTQHAGTPGTADSQASTSVLPKNTRSTEPLDGHQRMLQALRAIRRQRVYEQTFFGPQTVQAQELNLAASAPDPRSRFEELLNLSERRLWQGDTRHALEHLFAANELLTAGGNGVPAGVRKDLYFRLGLANLRLGENENCVNCNNGESCLIPIANAGIHENRTGSEQAIVYLLKALELDPQDLTARWLLNIANMTLGQYPDGVPQKFRIPQERFQSEREFPRFPNVATELGLNLSSLSGGCVVDDFDGDGDLDVIVSSWGEGDELQFFRNDGGKFFNQSEAANFAGIFGGLNLQQADYDNDGDIDLLVLRGAWIGDFTRIPNSLLRNDGTGRFTDVTFDCGLGDESYPTQTAAWFDFDNDGDLDLYVGNEKFPSQLFENVDGQNFRDVAAQAGVQNGKFTKGVTAGDYNNDGYPDLYVSNLEGPNQLYRNNRDGTFTDVAEELHVTEPLDSFPVWFWDYNQDGNLDLFVSGYTIELDCIGYQYFGVTPPRQFSCLYEGDGQGGFRDVTLERRLLNELPPMGSNFGDLDNDGYPDFYLGTGAPQYEMLVPNVMYWNQQGERFYDITTAGGFGHLQKGHGVSFADFDEDGDQDVFSEMGGAYPGDRAVNCVYQNPGFDHHWIKIRLVGRQSNRSAIGAKISVELAEGEVHRTVYKWINSGGSFGANPLRSEIGLGKADHIEQLTIEWPASGITQTFRDVALDQSVVIEEGVDEIVPAALPTDQPIE